MKLMLQSLLYQIMATFDARDGKQTFESIAVKGENAGNQHFLLFPQYVLYNLKEIASFEQH